MSPAKTTVFVPEQGEPYDALTGEFVTHVLNAIFDPGTIRDFLHQNFASEDGKLENFSALIGQLRGFFAQNISSTLPNAQLGHQDEELIKQAGNLAAFERNFRLDFDRYKTSDKPNPDAVFWPDPTRGADGTSLFDALPYTTPLKLISKTTPVGSAGSCFASEIAYYLQNNGYNYIVTEASERDGPQPESCARWGIIFNTPSFKQLAEKAFGLRNMPRLAEYHPSGEYWQDPFRENIPFSTVEELDADRELHLASCRDAFLQCKVFVITLGLNECWEFLPDGTVSSRSPKTMLHYALFGHRVLTVDENITNLQAFLDTLRQHNPEIQLIVTVSPVPFMATGLGAEKHVITANTHSKSVLRVAAEDFAATNDGVYYFPSYEMVTQCIEDPWEDDQRHVKSAAVARVMTLFEDMFSAA